METSFVSAEFRVFLFAFHMLSLFNIRRHFSSQSLDDRVCSGFRKQIGVGNPLVSLSLRFLDCISIFCKSRFLKSRALTHKLKEDGNVIRRTKEAPTNKAKVDQINSSVANIFALLMLPFVKNWGLRVPHCIDTLVRTGNFGNMVDAYWSHRKPGCRNQIIRVQICVSSLIKKC